MDLLELARSDTRDILAADCGTVTITAPGVGGAVYVVPGHFLRVGIDMNAEGMPVASDKATLTVSLVELEESGLANPDDLKAKGWTVAAGSLSLRVDQVLLDRALGRATMILKRTA